MSTVPPAGNPYRAASGVRAPKEGAGATLDDVRHEALFDLAVRWERLRQRPHWTWLAPAGYAVAGAGAGAALSGAKIQDSGVLVSFIVGGVLLLASRMVTAQRIESLDDLCDDFLRYLDRWPCDDPGHELNSDHVKSLASQSKGTKANLGIGFNRMLGRRSKAASTK